MNSFEKYVGQVFDNRYKITKILGVGGMAVVFEAFDTTLNRIVALKMLKQVIANDSQSVKRFINESKAVSMLSHPNIVKIYDVSVKDSLKYIVMERIDGITLKSYMSQKGVLSLKETIVFAEQILLALEHAHSKGIIHRDIKPQNIMLLKNGRIKVTDFGIAKLPNAETVTMTDKAIGTVYYISPEQASGKAIDARSDLYSLGVLMYEMCTGLLPFDAESPVSVALMQVNATPKAPRDIMPSVPRGIEQMIMLAMEKNPDQRFQNATQMLYHLTQVKNNPNYIFKTKRADSKGGSESKIKAQKKPQTKGGRSMFPVILGVTLAFLLVAAICAVVVIDRWQEDVAPTVSTEKKTIEVPTLTGQVLTEELRSQLEDMGFKIKEDDVYDAEGVAIGTITGQNREPGSKCMSGSEIILSIAAEGAVVPDVTGKDMETAKEVLEGKGFKTEVVYQDSAVAKDKVIRQSPFGGDKANVAKPVTLYVSNGKNSASVEMPNLEGLTVEEAKLMLEDAGLKLGDVSYETSSKTKDVIIAQSIEVGGSASPNEAVDVTVSLGN